MRRTRVAAFALILLGMLSVQACTDTPTAPPAAAAPAAEGLLGALLGLPVDVVHRIRPLATDEVVTRTLGSAGGVIVLPRSGLTVVVPNGALTSPTSITVTAPAGSLVGYYFAPHGLVFRRPLHASQDLSNTDLNLLQKLLTKPFAAYFQGSLQPQVNALELLPLNILGLLNQATFDIPHFSGYVIATD